MSIDEVGLSKAPALKISQPAMAGFVLGLISVVLYSIGTLPILAVIFSLIGVIRFDARKNKHQWIGWTGLTLGILFTLEYLHYYGYI